MKYKNHKAFRLGMISGIGSLFLIFCLSVFPTPAQQDQGTMPGYPVGSGQQDPGAPPPSASAPESNSAPSQAQNPPESAAPPPAANQPVPSQLIVPTGTAIEVRTNEWLSTSRNLPGDGFHATLAQPIIVNGWVVARRGQAVLGRVSMVQKDHGTTKLGLQLSELTFVDGQLLPIQTQLAESSAGRDAGRDVGVVGGTTGTGAIIGAIAGGGQGAAVGAGIGAIAGLGVITTHGRPTVVPPETLLTFQLQDPVTISTDKSAMAFRPVAPSDYNGGPTLNRRQYSNNSGNYPDNGNYPPPPPPPPYYGYPYAYSPFYYPYYGGWGYYPGPVVGFGFGFGGPRYGYGRFGRR